MDKITIDFETRSKCDLKKSGAFKYASDSSTSILCLAYKIPGEETKVWSPFYEERPQELFDVLDDYPIEAHNAQFEYALWTYHCVPVLGWPALNPDMLYCSAAKAAALSLPRALGQLSLALKVSKTKDMDGHRLMLKLSKPRKISTWNKNEWNDDLVEYERLLEYCIRDVDAEEECSNIMPELSKKERQVYLLDQKINDRGIYCDLESVDTALGFIDLYYEELLIELKEITNGDIYSASQVAKILSFLRNRGVRIESLTAGEVQRCLDLKDLDVTSRRVLEIRQALGKTSIKKFKAMKAMAGEDGRIRGTLLYHGANTGRWAGRGIQPHNLPKGTESWEEVFATLNLKDYELFKLIHPDVIGALSSSVRGMLCAAPGKILMSADYAAIEARVLLWLVGDEKGLDIFRSGKCIYRDMASGIYGKKIIDIDMLERALGKVAILGLGFGMGHIKFKDTCANWGIEISSTLSRKTVYKYRDRYESVVRFWYAIEAAAKQAIEKPRRVIKCGKIFFKVEKGYLFIKLPSGRKLAYYDPQIKKVSSQHGTKAAVTFMGIDTYTRKWMRLSTYGGKLVENITQAVARDIMVDSMLGVEEKGYQNIFTVHDEIICEVDKDFGSLEEFENLMAVAPKWALDCPISVEGWAGKRYRK